MLMFIIPTFMLPISETLGLGLGVLYPGDAVFDGWVVYTTVNLID